MTFLDFWDEQSLFLRALFVLSKSFLSYGFCYKCHFYFLPLLVQILWNKVAQKEPSLTFAIKRDSSDHEINWNKEKKCHYVSVMLFGILVDDQPFFFMFEMSKSYVCVCEKKHRLWDLKM